MTIDNYRNIEDDSSEPEPPRRCINCRRPAEYPDHRCRDCHEDAVRREAREAMRPLQGHLENTASRIRQRQYIHDRRRGERENL